MSRHFSPEEISRWFAGERSAELERHAAGGEECGGRLHRMETTMAEFRGAARARSETQAAPAPRFSWRAPVQHMVRRWVLATATLLILASGPAYWQMRQQTRAAELARADALLQQVDAEISRAVPQTMEPLVSLVTWGPGPTEDRSEKERQ